jgi:hypothetical protein
LNFMKTTVNLFLCVMLMGGCVATDVDRRADFARYRTYAFGKSKQGVENPLYRSGLIDENIKTTIREELAKKGMVYKKSGADLLVSYETFVEKEDRFVGPFAYPAYPPPFWGYWGYGYGWGMPYYGWYSMPMGQRYSRGTLVIDFHERRTGKQIWRGSVSDGLEDPDKIEKQIQKGVRVIIRKYPSSPLVPEIDVKPKKVTS